MREDPADVGARRQYLRSKQEATDIEVTNRVRQRHNDRMKGEYAADLRAVREGRKQSTGYLPGQRPFWGNINDRSEYYPSNNRHGASRYY